MYEEKFSRVLDDDEKIIQVYKPHLGRALIVPNIIAGLFLIADIVGMLYFAFNETLIEVTEEIDGIQSEPELVNVFDEFWWIFAIFGGFLLIGILVNVVKYLKTFYAFTNKKVVFRSGFIGADFKTLDYKTITGCDVYVDLLDKIMHPNTGSIIFASPTTSAFINYQPGGNMSSANRFGGYSMVHLSDAYNTYKAIKKIVDEHK